MFGKSRLGLLVLAVTLACIDVTLSLSPSRSRVVDLSSFTPIDSLSTSSTTLEDERYGEGQDHNVQFPFDPRNYFKTQPAPDDRKHRQLASNLLQSPSSEYGTGDDFGEYAAAGGYGGGGHGSGHASSHKGGGWQSEGYGHGGHGPKKKDCNSAIGLLGTLGLISFLTSVLRGLNIPPMNNAQQAAATRTRRGAAEAVEDDRTHHITRLMLPLMIRVSQARDANIPTRCTIHEVCRANRILVKEIGEEGRYLGAMISEAITKLLLEVPPKGSTTVAILSQVGDAGRSGRSDLDCDILFPPCPNLPPADVPEFLSILKSPLGKAYTSKYSAIRNPTPTRI